MRTSLAALLALLSLAASAQPVPLRSDLAVRRLMDAPAMVTQLARDPRNEDLWLLGLDGSLYQASPPYASASLVSTSADHGVGQSAQGLAVGPDGAVYLSGNVFTASTIAGIVRRGRPLVGGGFAWATVAETVPYPRNDYGSFNHLVNALALAPDGASLFINSGSRTDHGEPGPAGSTHPGVREVPLTSAVLRVPAAAEEIVLPNDEAALRAGGYLFADGVRNTFSLAFDGEGRLYGAENSGDRDDGDEINWLREGHHYGFPWRMGEHDTPQRFPGYQPSADVLLNPDAPSVLAGFFHDDPGYPLPPAGVTFTDPVQSEGPDADAFRDPTSGAIADASAAGVRLATMTPHSSPLGLAFDVADALPAPFTGDGLVLRFTSGAPGQSVLFEPFGEPGEDLLHLDFQSPESIAVRRIAAGFASPTDAVLIGRSLVVVEFGGTRGLWAVDFNGTVAAEPSPSAAVEVRMGPNPFRDGAVVSVRLPAPERVTIEVVDVRGRRVMMLDAGTLGEGAHDLRLDGRAWPAGVLLVHVHAGAAGTTRTLVHVR